MIDLRQGDCLELLKDIPSGSVDLILTDPPYGTTACKWDSVIDFDLMWSELKRIIKPNGAICLFGSEPFSSALRMSNINDFKYDWVWDKRGAANPMLGKIQPMKTHELISVFGEGRLKYNPIMQLKNEDTLKRQKRVTNKTRVVSEHFSHDNVVDKNPYGYPKSIQYFKKETNNQYKRNIFHPTQKPIALLEYLIKTYSNEGDTVLDFTMGSGSTGVACVNTNREFIGIELGLDYFKIAEERINQAAEKGGFLIPTI